MSALISIVIGLAIGFSPLGNSRVLKIIIIALTGG